LASGLFKRLALLSSFYVKKPVKKKFYIVWWFSMVSYLFITFSELKKRN